VVVDTDGQGQQYYEKAFNTQAWYLFIAYSIEEANCMINLGL